ncbi:MAG: KH domain-containing protein [Erysipelothrix sp.]|nr:KH domain-containing protein [Erysipelothrix sp.]
MKDIENILYDLVLPMVENQASLKVQQLESLNEKEIILNVYADNSDIARLIGRQGTMAQAIRQVMMVGSRVLNKKISINFESY